MRSFRRAGQTGAIAAAVLVAGLTAMAQSQTTTPPTSAGPGRIICKSIKSCELDVGTPPTTLRYKIDASSLGDADKDRLVKQCTAKGTPCVATVTGPETKGVVQAATIKFFN